MNTNETEANYRININLALNTAMYVAHFHIITICYYRCLAVLVGVVHCLILEDPVKYL